MRRAAALDCLLILTRLSDDLKTSRLSLCEKSDVDGEYYEAPDAKAATDAIGDVITALRREVLRGPAKR